MLEPAPTGPTCSTRRHIWASSGLARAKSSAVPPATPSSLPSRAGPTVPPTGHSTKTAPLARTFSASATSVSGCTVLISMTSLPLMVPASRPAGPS